MSIVGRVACSVRRRGDSGVTLTEVLVALTLLTGLGLLVAASLVSVQKSAFKSKERSAAANLATREVEIVRNLFHASDTAPLTVMSAGDVTNAAPLPGQTGPLVVDGVPYTVKREVAWLITGTGASACDGGAVVAYPSVSLHVLVTWPSMGNTPPVVSDTILTPPKNVLNATYGYLAVKVTDRDGLPNESRHVTATGPAGTLLDTTGPDGCATFVIGTVGTYTVSMTDGSSGYVSYNGSSSQTAIVAAGSLVTRAFTYDLGESFNISLTPPAGYPLPVSRPAVVLGNSGILPAGVGPYTSNASGTTLVGPVWPFASGYAFWAGSCPDNDPANDTGRPAALTPAKGSTTNTQAKLQGLTVITTKGGIPVNVPVTATYAGPGTCSQAADANLSLGTSTGAGVLLTSLPLGSWTLSTTISGQPVTALIDVGNASVVTATLNGT
jgi:type II secretory pathway pseudopilin PulG